MFRSYRVGTVFGIPFRLDITFLFILPVFAWVLGAQISVLIPRLNETFGTTIDPGPLTQGVRPLVIGAIAAVSLFACVALHELGHSVVARHYDYEVESITLWLLGGLAKPAELPKNWLHEFWIAVAGPLVNVVIATACGLVLLVVPSVDVVVFLLLFLGLLNVSLAVFNMLPAFPLDGGRVLRALLARNRSYVDATRTAATVGKGFAILLGLGGLLMGNFFLLAIALFVYIAATSESRQMMLDAAFEGVEIEDVMTPADELVTVEADTPISDLLDVMLEERHSGYPVLDTGDFVGIVTLEDIQSVDRKDAVAAEQMTPVEQLATIDPSAEVMAAFRMVGETDIGRLPVVDSGELLGIITRTDLMRAFKIVTARDQFEGERLNEEQTPPGQPPRDRQRTPSDERQSEWEFQQNR
ncbi:MAG: site-2 protease family protein [Halovenus sp.]|uniref:site-2 protease family protein n=1 Tax=Halovenus amylolytica TaxID=2500550 RepID=UPI000FE3619D